MMPSENQEQNIMVRSIISSKEECDSPSFLDPRWANRWPVYRSSFRGRVFISTVDSMFEKACHLYGFDLIRTLAVKYYTFQKDLPSTADLGGFFCNLPDFVRHHGSGEMSVEISLVLDLCLLEWNLLDQEDPPPLTIHHITDVHELHNLYLSPFTVYRESPSKKNSIYELWTGEILGEGSHGILFGKKSPIEIVSLAVHCELSSLMKALKEGKSFMNGLDALDDIEGIDEIFFHFICHLNQNGLLVSKNLN